MVLVNLDNILDIRVGLTGQAENKNIYYITENTIMLLGTYSSTERCKEILEDIIDFYTDVQQSNSVFSMPNE